MVKNILLLFLSDVKTRKDGENIVVSETPYTNVEGEKTQTTNESAIRYLLETTPLDKIFIFASKKVRGEIAYVNRKTKERLLFRNDDQKIWTHLDFSRERFKKFLPGVDNSFFDVLPFDEDQSDDENLKSVAEMAGRIQKFVAQFGDEEFTLHVDLTGGMRHINMMMLELTRLLEYSGLKIGNVLYSNYDGETAKGTVEEIQNVYDLFQLIAGVEEFVNFGSVKALTGDNGYYKGKTLSEPMRKLLDAMKTFAESIKLCHYGQFSKAVEDLHDAVNDFNKNAPANVEDILMARLIGRIKKSYHDLIAIREKDDLRVIRWCLNNDYLQQALTLYTERIPEYLGEKKIITQSKEEEKNLLELVGKDDMGRNRWFYLFSDVKPREDLLSKGKKEYCKAVKDAAQKIAAKKPFDFAEWLQTLNDKLKPLNLYCTDDKDLRVQFETLIKIFKDHTMLRDLGSDKLDPIRSIIVALSSKVVVKTDKNPRRREVLAYFLNSYLSEGNITEYFVSNGFMKLMKDCSHAIKIYELLIENIFSISIPTENFLSIADKYYRIKIERNHSNHAHEVRGNFETADELRRFMSDALKEIEDNLPSQ